MLEEMANLIQNDMKPSGLSDEEEKKSGDSNEDSDDDDDFEDDDRDTAWAGASQRKKSKSPLRGNKNIGQKKEEVKEPARLSFDHTLQTIAEAQSDAENTFANTR